MPLVLLLFFVFFFFFSCFSQSVICFRPLFLFLLLMFVFCFLFFSLAPLSYSSSYILSELLPLIKNNAFTFWGWCNHCLASLGRFFVFFNQNPFRFVAIRFLFFGQNYPTAIDHFTVVCSATWPVDGSEARVDLVLIQTSLLLSCKCTLLTSEQLVLHNKRSEVCIITGSTLASLPSKGQVTKQTTVNWSIAFNYLLIATSQILL